MKQIECDVAVIGAGSAGIAAYRAATKAGARAVLIERGPGGTTCARVGCMPSKLLTTAATAAYDARDAGRFGIRVASVHVDGPEVMARVRRERDRFVGSVFDELATFPEETCLCGNAIFDEADTLSVGDHTRVRFKAAVIATGSSPSVPEPLKGLGERVLTTDTLFEISDLPPSIAVLGGGPVGLEAAQALARLGVKTTLFDPSDSLGGLSDPALMDCAHEAFGQDMELLLGAEVEHAEIAGDECALRWSHKDGRKGTGTFARVLAAAGRPPNLKGIGLDRAGLSLDEKGSPAYDKHSLRCEGAPIFIAGDANHDRPVLHEANRQGGIAGRNAAALALGNVGEERPPRWTAMALVFTHPQIALVGAGYEPDGDRLTGSVNFGEQGRARVMGRAEGAARIYADKSGRLLGAEMLGPDVEHLAHILAFAIEDGHTAQTLRAKPFYHPTLEEGLETALSEIARNAR